MVDLIVKIMALLWIQDIQDAGQSCGSWEPRPTPLERKEKAN